MLREGFQDFFANMLTKAKVQGTKIPEPVPVAAIFYAGGLTSSVVWWISNDFNYFVEEMALCLYNIISEIIPDKIIQ